MNNIANTTTLWQLLGKSKVVIPILQRDYAQGRIGYENLREKFLSAIYKSFHGEQLKLDFVYGSSDQEGRFNPLDGQQRLTTLWLLHWFLAFRLGKLTDETVIEHLANFSYETRLSSSRFCQRLVTRGADINQLEHENIADAIIRQTWIPSVWRQDPTVQSMLRMLSGEQNGKIDGIEQMFGKEDKLKLTEYWDALMMPAAKCPLVFYLLDIENLGQSDDLYVKMNGRGKPLSNYENFKADLIKYIEDNEWSSLLDETKGLPILLDTTWIDFFWQYRTEEISLDDIIFGFINRYLLVRLMMTQKPQRIEADDLGDLAIEKAFKFLYSFTEGKNARDNYNLIGFGVYQTIFETLGGVSVLNDLRTVLNNISKFKRETLTSCIKYPYETSDEKFELVYTSGRTDLYRQTITETISFWAVCQFFLSPSAYCTKEQLTRWMRIVWNVCNYKVIVGFNVDNEIRSRTALRSTILALHDAFPCKWDVYNTNTFNAPTEKDKTALHIIEEQEKILQINNGDYNGSVTELQGKTWEQIITETERLRIFTGTIRALFTNANGNTDWSFFDKKYTNIMWYLNKYADLNSIAFRNILLQDYQLCHERWFPKGARRDAFWRELLPYYKPNTVHTWLITPPLNHNQLSAVIPNDEPSYAKRSIIRTTLLQDVTYEYGMHVIYSDSNKNNVFLYYHTSNNPYVIFNEVRDKVIAEAIDKNIITLCNPNIRKPCGLFNAKDIIFHYRGVEYNWHAKGVIYRQDNPTNQLSQPNSIASLLNAFIILQIIDLIKVFQTNSDFP